MSFKPKQSYTDIANLYWQNHKYKKLLVLVLKGKTNVKLKLTFTCTARGQNAKHKEIGIQEYNPAIEKWC